MDVETAKPSPAESAAERDRAGGVRDRAADRRDAAAGRRDLAGSRRDQIGDDRDVVARSRDEAGDDRDEAAGRRDQNASRRDVAAEERDRLADARDRKARLHETDGEAAESATSGSGDIARARRAAAGDRGHAARDRAAGAAERGQAEQDRDTALSDRGRGAVEREAAGADRLSAAADRGWGDDGRVRSAGDRGTSLADRDRATNDLTHASLDGLTGVYTRSAGLLELQREVDRSRRSGTSLVVAFVDVDGLKAVNDEGGHAAGDRVLVRVARALTEMLRPYDLVVRYGGDEFLCVLPGAASAEAFARLHSVNASLAGGDAPASVSVGVSDLRPADTLARLIERADDELYALRREARASGRSRGRRRSQPE